MRFHPTGGVIAEIAGEIGKHVDEANGDRGGLFDLRRATQGSCLWKYLREAFKRVELKAPIVIRLDGTNAEQGREILKSHESDRLVSKPTMVEAARTAVALAKGN